MEDAPQPELAQKSPSAADALAARREARRKRILENSNNRLTKITGREHNEPVAEDISVKPPETIYPDPEDEQDVYQQSNVQWSTSSQDTDVASILRALQQANGSVPGAGSPLGSAGARSPSNPPVPESSLVKILRTRIHIALMAIGVYLLFATEQQHLIGGSVFIVLLGWETLEVFLLKTYETSSGSFLDVVFLLGGISSRYSQILTRLTQTVNKVLKDVAFFMFFFVLTHLLWSNLVLGIELKYVLGYEQLESAPTNSPSG